VILGLGAFVTVIRRVLVLALVTQAAIGADWKDLAKKLTEFRLSNGLHFLVLERHEAPQTSFAVRVRTGSEKDPRGMAGLAYVVASAFNGSETLGTKDWTLEKKALDDVEEIYDRLSLETDIAKKATLDLQLKIGMDRARMYGSDGAYRRAMEEGGAFDGKSAPGFEGTTYSWTLPYGRAELWFQMESQRFQRPVLREFYSERARVTEELKQQPFWDAGEVGNLRRKSGLEFVNRYYQPGNVTVAMVGDIDPAEARRLAERYFGSWKARVPATPEPTFGGARQISRDAVKVVAFRTPPGEGPALEILQYILGSRFTGMLQRELIDDQHVAQAAAVAARSNGLFVFRLTPAPGHNGEENEKALLLVLGRLSTQEVDADSLQSARRGAWVSRVAALETNSGAADLLSSQDSWPQFESQLDRLDRVSAADVARVAKQVFAAENRVAP